MRYEDGLAARFEQGDVSLTLMALAHIGGFAERLPGWLAASQQEYPKPRKFGNAYSMLCRRAISRRSGGAP